MSLGPTRGNVLNCMRKALREENVDGWFGHLMTLTLTFLAQDKLIPTEQNYQGMRDRLDRENPTLNSHLLDAYIHLVVSGIIIPKPQAPNFPSFNRFVLTSFGKEWIIADHIIPEDAIGFLSALKHSIQALDPVVEQYIQEALVTYDRKAFFAAAVMLGAASEKVVYQLMEALQGSVKNKQRKSELANAMERRGLPKMFQLIEDTLESAIEKKKIPYDVHEGCHHHLMSIIEAIRVQRNDAVHPAIAEVDQQRVWMSLIAFPAACRKVHDLIEWLGENKI